MKPLFIKCSVISMLIFSCFSASAYSEEKIGETTTAKKIHYSGDDNARSICTAIAKDSLSRLKRSLKSRKVGILDTKVHLRYGCNDQNLFDFARSMKSHKSAGYLAEKFGVKDYIAEHSDTENSGS